MKKKLIILIALIISSGCNQNSAKTGGFFAHYIDNPTIQPFLTDSLFNSYIENGNRIPNDTLIAICSNTLMSLSSPESKANSCNCIKYLRAITKPGPYYYDAGKLMVSFHLFNNERKAALDVMKTLHRHSFDFFEATLFLGALYEWNNNIDSSKLYYQKSAKLLDERMPEKIPNDVFNYIIVNKLLGNSNKADSLLHEAMKNEPNNMQLSFLKDSIFENFNREQFLRSNILGIR